ncbi:hypothetical protein Acr_27g0007350 [Actinidia rufa]|uniref:Uncharacterized protein n=1 Tax=Actinidia rufa TaxID=165716 RepID=A0A7J0H7E2_9ERIC|nr:hypothetical protein Acr_27g0007350 [Actinidia rufa]
MPRRHTSKTLLEVAESDLNDAEKKMEIVKKKLLLRPTVNVSSGEEMLALLLLVHEDGWVGPWEGTIRVPQEVLLLRGPEFTTLGIGSGSIQCPRALRGKNEIA